MSGANPIPAAMTSAAVPSPRSDRRRAADGRRTARLSARPSPYAESGRVVGWCSRPGARAGPGIWGRRDPGQGRCRWGSPVQVARRDDPDQVARPDMPCGGSVCSAVERRRRTWQGQIGRTIPPFPDNDDVGLPSFSSCDWVATAAGLAERRPDVAIVGAPLRHQHHLPGRRPVRPAGAPVGRLRPG